MWPYEDWTRGIEGKSALAKHFVFLSEDVSDWLVEAGETPWILDPKEYPKLVPLGPDSAGPGSGGSTQKRKWRKKHHHRRRPELKVTNCGERRDSPVWYHGAAISSSEFSSSGPDSGLGSPKKSKGDDTAGSPVQQSHPGSADQTPLLSPNTICQLDEDGDGDINDSPLSNWEGYKASNGD